MKNDETKKSIVDAQKQLDKARRCLTAVQKALGKGAVETLTAVESAVAVMRTIKIGPHLHALEQIQGELKQQLEDLLQERREKLIHSARNAGWSVNRLRDEDRIGCFKLEYRRLQVVVNVGSETLCKFQEADGEQVFNKLKGLLEGLQSFPFTRESFFQSVKDGLRFAEVRGVRGDNDGHVFVRELYPMIVLGRVLRDPTFTKRPNFSKVEEYSLVQFIFDFARFGEEGWSMPNDQRLSAPTPNSEQVARGNTITLPQLGHDGRSVQVGRLGIRK